MVWGWIPVDPRDFWLDPRYLGLDPVDPDVLGLDPSGLEC